MESTFDDDEVSDVATQDYDLTGYAPLSALGKCAEAPARKSAAGTQVRIWDCNGSNAQNWAKLGTNVTGPLKHASGNCLAARGGSSADGTAVEINRCNGSAAQNWTHTSSGEVKGPGEKCLDVNGGSSANGALLILSTCNGDANQRWTLGDAPTAAITVNAATPSSAQATAGSSFNLTYNFSGGPSSEAMTVFVHFLDEAGTIAFASDHSPPTATNTWTGGVVSYTRSVSVSSTVASGTYRTAVGLYSPTTGTRLALQAGTGVTDLGSSRYQVGTVTIGTTTPPPPPTSEPSTTVPGSFTERACTRQYSLTGLQEGTQGDAVANGDRMRTVINAAMPGDCITVAPGHYRLAGNIDFNVPDITLKGLGTTREGVWFEHTTETRAIFMVKAGGVHFYNFTHRVYATARSSLGQSGEGNIWVQGGHTGFRMQDVLAWGSRDAAIFLYGVHQFQLNRVESRDSKSDAYHVTNGSSYGTWYDCKSANSGDDGIGFVGYGAEGAATPHHHTVVRHHVAGQAWGRGFGIIHTNNITFHGPTLIEDSAGAAVIIAREPGYGSGSVRAIRFYGELRTRRANSNTAIGHGAILINNPDTVAPIEDVVITGPVLLVDTRSTASGQVLAFGSGTIKAEIGDVRFHGTGPSTRLSTSLASGSYLNTPGWSASTPYSGAEPAFPIP